ncbi:MAG TPA: biopolymer transporter ExbD [Bacteroidia bacterium]|nr:biopolymer transporter ExbD [Bacteroidia bacterium]
MAEIADGGGGGGKHKKKGRGAKGNPRVDMTPMVDLAFLLLTFFVLTSNLNKAKTMEMAVPKDSKENKTKIPDELANTVLLDGNKDGIIYYYGGKLSDSTKLYDLTLDPKKGIRKTIANRNQTVQTQMKYVRDVYKSGKFGQENYNKIKGFVTENTQPGPLDEQVVKDNKAESYSDCIGHMDRDLKAGEMSDSTYKKIGAVIRNSDKAPFFIVKWGGDATYGDVINLIDELKIGDVAKYALTKISRVELQALSAKTGIHYPELDLPDPDAPPETP